jgi:glyoxylate reductase
MARPKVFVTRGIAQEALNRIAGAAEMELWTDELPPPYETLKEKAQNADGMLTLLSDRVDAGLMDAAPGLKVVSNMAVGYDNIDVPEATKRHILVGNTPEVLTETTADFAFALLLSAARRVAEGDKHTRAGKWTTWGPMIMLGQDIHNATLGIIGLGRIGTAVARRAKGFDMKLLYHDEIRRTRKKERELGVEYVPELMKLLSRSDFVSIHVPLLPHTHHFIGPAELAAMKPSAVLVNTSRGSVVDQKALYEALNSGQIFAAAIDVTEAEPIAKDDPLLSLDNIVITPHIASASFSTRGKMAMMAADNLLAGLEGEIPPNCVNPQAFGKSGE